MRPTIKRVLVTGGASGIGAAVAARFADEGAEVTVLDRDPPADSRVRFILGDVRKADSHRRAVEAASGRFSTLDVLVANAGVHDGGMTFDSSAVEVLEDNFRRVLDINVIGYLLSLAAARESLRRANGCAILTLSDASFDVIGNGAGLAYATAKHAGLGLLKAAARDLGPEVRVNAVAPGGISTRISVESETGTRRRLLPDPERLAAKLAGRTLLGRGVTLDEVVAAYVFLASPAASGLTGQVLRVDAGRLA